MTFIPQTYAEALEKRKPRPQKARKPIKRRSDKAILRDVGAGTVFPAKARKSIARSLKPIPRGAAKRKKKKLSVGNLKKKVWTQFSIFIRTRGADLDGWNTCVTCGARKFWKDLQAGHFIAGRLNNNLFDEDGCHPQCSTCNVLRSGNTVRYYRWMVENYGEQTITALLYRNNQTRKWQAGELQELLDHYSRMNELNPLVENQPCKP